LDLGVTQFKDKQQGNVSTVLGVYNLSQSQTGMGQFYGLGYDLPVSAKNGVRFSLNHYDFISGG